MATPSSTFHELYAVPPATVKVGPFTNFQPDLYWTQTSVSQPGGQFGCCAAFSFNSGWQGSNITANFLFVFPMIQGKIAGTPAAVGKGREQLSPADQAERRRYLAESERARRAAEGARHAAAGGPQR